jgi:hypothetical protein
MTVLKIHIVAKDVVGLLLGEVVSTKKNTLLQAYTNLVFLVGIWLVFLSIYQIDTGGKLGRYVSVLFFWWELLFSSKGGSWPPFQGAHPPF